MFASGQALGAGVAMTSWWDGGVRLVLAAQCARRVSGYPVLYPWLCRCALQTLPANAEGRLHSDAFCGQGLVQH